MSDSELQGTEYRVKLWLFVASLATVVVMTAAALRENMFNDWRPLRVQYGAILADKATDELGEAAARQFEIRLVQNYLPALNAVDRCATCHAGVQDPRMADQQQPFKTHPGRYLEIHDPEKFGCTVCHEGQGRATETDEAHGEAPFWDYPMLETRYVVASCTKCHGEDGLFGPDGLIAQAVGTEDSAAAGDLLEQGRALMTNKGCLGCHTVNGKGGRIGPDLSLVGNKTKHDFDFSRLGKEAPREVTYWLREHFRRPQDISPGSLMPPVTEGEDAVDAITAYMLSLRRKETGVYAGGESAGGDEIETHGHGLYSIYCSACHGVSGESSGVPGIETPALNNADTLGAASDDFYRFIIESGRSGTHMPAWGKGGGGLDREEIDAIVGYIRGWQQSGAEVADVDSRLGHAASGRSYYLGMCAGCHGRNGRGGLGNSLRSPTFLAIADDRFMAETIIGGRPGTAMPSWRHLRAQEISDLLAYVRTWQATAASFEEVVASMAELPAEKNARFGKRLYENHCASCHGRKLGGGIGPSLASPQFLGAVDDRYLHRAITAGRPTTAMPAWSHLDADKVGAIIAYLRSYHRGSSPVLAKAPPPGDYEVGELYYSTSCERCHGPAGIGGVGPQLANPVFLASVSDEILYHWIANGRTGTAMRGFLAEAQGPTELEPDQIADVIAYLRYVGTREDLPLLRTGAGHPTVGRELYGGHCVSCHGSDGEGASGPQLNNPTFLETASDGFLAATIVLGRTGTPMERMVHGVAALGGVSPDNVQDIVAYMRLWEYPTTWRKVRNITEISDWAVASGRNSFARYCSGCHGTDGGGGRDGDGYYAPALNNQEFLEAASDGLLLATIARGRAGTPMRPFGEGGGGIVSLASEEISDIVAYIRTWEE